MNDVSGAVGGGEQVESLDEVWHLCRITPGIRDDFGQWCKMRGRQAAQGDPALMATFLHEAEAGAYRWGGPLDRRGAGSGIVAALSHEEGNVRLIGMLLEPRHGILPDERLEQIVSAAREQFALAVRECLRMPPPNGRSPERTEGARSGQEAGQTAQTATDKGETAA